MSGELTPSQPLVEATLAEWCQVSRTPIREALMRLEQDGLAQRTDRGLIVRESSPDEILDLYETRIVLESMAAEVAAKRYTSFDLIAIRRAGQRYAATGTEDPRALADRNREFHRAIWLASHNRPLVDLLERLDMHLGRYPITTLTFPGRFELSVKEHDDLVAAIRDRDATKAADIASHHFSAAQDIRLKLWEQE
jgi:DNA-binding GntR family transcriptional regulator